jgi:hypothetical protein
MRTCKKIRINWYSRYGYLTSTEQADSLTAWHMDHPMMSLVSDNEYRSPDRAIARVVDR